MSCLTTSSLSWYMDLTFQVPMQYCFLQHRTLFHHQSHPQLGFIFALAPSLHLFWSYFSTDLHPLAFWAPTDLGISSFSILTFCLFMLFMGSQGKNSEVVFHSLLQWTTFCQTLHHDLIQWNYEPCCVGPPKMDGSWWRVLTKYLLNFKYLVWKQS